MIRVVTTFFYVGYLRPAPGSWGSAAALAAGVVIDRFLGFPALVLATLAVIPLGYWAVARDLPRWGEGDPSQIVIDEVAGQWLTLLFPAFAFWRMGLTDWALVAWPGWVAAFLFFRLFDIWKPWLVGRADRKGGASGVMEDDLWAGLFAGIAVMLAAGLWHGVAMR